MVNGQPLCQLVPDGDDYGDYRLRMFELVTGVAELEDRQASEVIDAILRHANDSKPNGALPGHIQGAAARETT